MKYAEQFYTTRYGHAWFRLLKYPLILCKYRASSVPGTGKNLYGHYHYFRRPRTTQERRWAYAYPEYIRGRRSGDNLAEAWDDAQRSNCGNKSWKQRKKRKQWM